MANFDALDPNVVCHPILPANQPVDQVRYSTILPVKKLVNGVAVPMEIPAALLMPNMLGNVRVASDSHRRKLHQAATSEGTMVEAWARVEVTTQSGAVKAKVASLGELLSRGKIKMEAGERGLQLDPAAIESLSRGQPALVRLDDGDEVELHPDYPIADGQYVMPLDAPGRAALLASREVLVAGIGRKALSIDGGDVDALLRSGHVTVKFIDNPEATLTLVMQDAPASATQPLVMREWTTGEAAAAAAVGMAANMADRLVPRMARRDTGTRDVPDDEPPPGGGRGGRPRSTGASQPVPGTGSGAGTGAGTASPPPEPPEASLPRFPVVLHVPYLQDWTLNGYARGALLNTISMGPLEETTIEVFSWERHRREAETSSGSEAESSTEGSINNKVTLDVVDETRRENGWKLDVGVDVSYPGSPVGGHVGLDVKDELVKNTKNATQHINDATRKAATKIKSTRQTKVIETSEFGSETKVVRRLKNPNTGRTLNLDAFEVVAHYNVATHLDKTGVRLAVLAEMYDFLAPMLIKGPGQKEALLSFEHVIAPLVPANLRSGFAAARLLLAAERICSFKCNPSCTCEDAGAGGSGLPPEKALTREQQLLLELPALSRRVIDAINAIASAGYVTLGQTIKQYWDNVLNPDPNSRPSQAQWDSARQEAKRYLFRRFVMDGAATRFWASARAFAASDGGESAAKLIVAARKVQGIDALNTIALFVGLQPRVIGEIVGMIGSGWPLVAPDLIASGLGFDDADLESSLNALQSVVDELQELRKPPPAPAGDAGDGAAADPAAAVEKPDYEPKALAEASIDFDLLTRYLLNNANFFRAQLWKSIDPADRLRFLTIYGALGSLTTGRILGFVGTSAVLELDVSVNPELEKWFDTLTGQAALDEATHSFDTILPTPAVTLEARLGACDALEPYLAESRSIELARSRSIAEQQALEVTRRTRKLSADELDDPQPRPPLLQMDRPTP